LRVLLAGDRSMVCTTLSSGSVNADLIKNAAQTDMYMAVLFEVLPPEAQRKMLADRRLAQSTTVLPILKALRDMTKRPKSGQS
jgi:hypothetical protein